MSLDLHILIYAYYIFKGVKITILQRIINHPNFIVPLDVILHNFTIILLEKRFQLTILRLENRIVRKRGTVMCIFTTIFKGYTVLDG